MSGGIVGRPAIMSPAARPAHEREDARARRQGVVVQVPPVHVQTGAPLQVTVQLPLVQPVMVHDCAP
jgi:hypothetical protein